MRAFLLAAYAMLVKDAAEPGKIDALLDEPFPHELTPRERQLREMRRVADANTAAVAALGRTP